MCSGVLVCSGISTNPEISTTTYNSPFVWILFVYEVSHQIHFGKASTCNLDIKVTDHEKTNMWMETGKTQ